MRLCPHEDVHDRIRAVLGYVRDGEDNHRSVCALCWIENAEAGSARFHSPHGSTVMMMWSFLAIGGPEIPA